MIELREAICSHLKQFRGMMVRPEQIIVGAGTDYLYSMLKRRSQPEAQPSSSQRRPAGVTMPDG